MIRLGVFDSLFVGLPVAEIGLDAVPPGQTDSSSVFPSHEYGSKHHVSIAVPTVLTGYMQSVKAKLVVDSGSAVVLRNVGITDILTSRTLIDSFSQLLVWEEGIA